MKDQTVQEVMISELLESNDDNEMIQILDFVRKTGVPVTQDQAKASFLLQEYGMDDLAKYALSIRMQMTPTKKLFDFTKILTLADRIKGNAKLGNLLKANANPANNVQVPQYSDRK